MEAEIRAGEEIEARHEASLALIKEMDPVAFNKYDFEFDTILQRLPEGMKPDDTLESHRARCTENMTETHQFETMALADKFIKNRLSDFVLKEENAEHKYYICPHGQHEQCTGYARLFKKLGVNIIRVCFGHYGHETNLGQYRFTGIQFATIRLFSDFYWKKASGPEWNVHNIVYCFKHWYDDSHILHYLSIYDLRAIGKEIGKPEAATVHLPNGVFHAVRFTTIEEVNRFSHRTPSNQFQPCHADVNSLPLENGSHNGEGTSGPPQILNENGIPVINAITNGIGAISVNGETSAQETSATTYPDWFVQGANSQQVIEMWVNIHNHATELKNIAFMKMLAPNCSEEVFNDAQQIFEMLNQAAEIAHGMNEKIRAVGGNIAALPQLEPAPTFTVCLDDPLFRDMYPHPLGNYVGPVQQVVQVQPQVQEEEENEDWNQRPLASLVAPNGSTRLPRLSQAAVRNILQEPLPDMNDPLDFFSLPVGSNALPSLSQDAVRNFLQQPMPDILHQIWLNANAGGDATLPDHGEADFQQFERFRQPGQNIWAMPLPRRPYIPSRFYRATGINLNQKMREMREREREAFAEEVRQITLRELGLDTVEAAIEAETEVEAPISKNKKKKNKKKEKKKQQQLLQQQQEQPLRHLDP